MDHLTEIDLVADDRQDLATLRPVLEDLRHFGHHDAGGHLQTATALAFPRHTHDARDDDAVGQRLHGEMELGLGAAGHTGGRDLESSERDGPFQGDAVARATAELRDADLELSRPHRS